MRRHKQGVVALGRSGREGYEVFGLNLPRSLNATVRQAYLDRQLYRVVVTKRGTISFRPVPSD